MRSTPVFIEVIHSDEHANIQVCRKIMGLLFKQKIAPLPFASTLPEVLEVLRGMRSRGMAPGIFVINTFWAEELLSQLELILGQTPVLFFKRQIFLIETQSRSAAPVNNAQRITTLLENMNLKNSTLWTYGSKSTDDIAMKAAKAIIPFLNDNNFNTIRQGQFTTGELAAALRANPEQAERILGNASSASLRPPTVPQTTTELTPARVSAAPESQVPPPTSSHLSGLHGAISQMGVSTIISMLEMEKKTGLLSLMRGDITARVFVRKGRIIKATIKGITFPEGSAEGPETVYHVLAWRNGLFEFTGREITEEDQINLPTTSLLMEGARRMDETVVS